jgi:hypothetical protein
LTSFSPFDPLPTSFGSSSLHRQKGRKNRITLVGNPAIFEPYFVFATALLQAYWLDKSYMEIPREGFKDP